MALEHDLDSALAEAVRIAGSQTAYGRILKKRQSVVHGWLKNDTPLPAEYVLVTEKETGVPKERLRPDIYPPDTSARRITHVRRASDPAHRFVGMEPTR